MEKALQHQTTPQRSGLPPTCARGHHPDGPKADHALTFNLDHSSGAAQLIEVLQVKYLNNIIEKDHRFIKKLTKQTKGFKSFRSTSATLKRVASNRIHQTG